MVENECEAFAASGKLIFVPPSYTSYYSRFQKNKVQKNLGRLTLLSPWQIKNHFKCGFPTDPGKNYVNYVHWCAKIHLNFRKDHSLGEVEKTSWVIAHVKELPSSSDCACNVFNIFKLLLLWLPHHDELQFDLWAKINSVSFKLLWSRYFIIATGKGTKTDVFSADQKFIVLSKELGQ